MANDPFVADIGGERIQFEPAGFNPGKRSGKAGVKGEWKGAFDAQFFIGLSVDGVPRWNAEEIRDAIFKWRDAQIQSIVETKRVPESEFEDIQFGATITPALGFWKTFGEQGEPREDSVSVLVSYVPNSYESTEDFELNMKAIGIKIAENFEQDSVLIRMLNNGQVVNNIEIAWGV
jgi:hypothetical protein